MVINEQGWVVTAGHALGSLLKAQADAPAVAALRSEIAGVMAKPLQPSQRASQLKRLDGKADREWIVNQSLWWADDNARIAEGVHVAEADLAILRIENLPPALTTNPAVFKAAPEPLPQGLSLCRLGFPFHDLKVKFDEARGAFDLGNLVLTYFPNDGILTRGIDGGMTSDGKHAVLFLETSTPGIRGQSGGPVFDIDANVWGIQVQTRSIQLDFSPEVRLPNGHVVVEHQVMNLGVAVQTRTITSKLDEMGVRYTVAP